MSQETLDFSGVEPVEGGGYLSPGYYHVKPTGVELVEAKEAGKSSSIKVEFTAINDPYEGQMVKAQFFLSAKALPRLQYLHERYFGVKLENKAITFKQLEEYFSKKMLAKPKTIFLSVSGREGTDGKIYGDLPFADFIIDEGIHPEIEEGAFEEGSALYNKSIRKQKNVATMSNSAVLSNGNAQTGWKAPWEAE